MGGRSHPRSSVYASAHKTWQGHIQICNVIEYYESHSQVPKLISDLILGRLWNVSRPDMVIPVRPTQGVGPMFTAIVSLATGGFAAIVNALEGRRFDWRLLEDNDTIVVRVFD